MANATLTELEAEAAAASRLYLEKLQGIAAFAKAVLAAKPSDADVAPARELVTTGSLADAQSVFLATVKAYKQRVSAELAALEQLLEK